MPHCRQLLLHARGQLLRRMRVRRQLQLVRDHAGKESQKRVLMRVAIHRHRPLVLHAIRDEDLLDGFRRGLRVTDDVPRRRHRRGKIKRRDGDEKVTRPDKGRMQGLSSGPAIDPRKHGSSRHKQLTYLYHGSTPNPWRLNRRTQRRGFVRGKSLISDYFPPPFSPNLS